MRYLNTTTLKQTTEYLDSTTVIDTDPRVKNWFTKCPDGYKGEWVDGTYTFVLIPLPNESEILESKKIIKLNEINTACDNAIIGGFNSEALGAKHFYYSTIAEQSTLNSLVAIGIDNKFKAQKVNADESLADRVQYLHTVEQLKGVLVDGATHIGTVIAKKDELEALIAGATTIEEVEAIVSKDSEWFSKYNG